jgi:mono/diheme cytochrome c family protein
MPDSFRNRLLLTLAASTLGAGLSVHSSAQETSGSPAGRGEYLFTEGYKCFACHGYDGQSGERRLVPLNYNVEGFTALVQNSPFPQMPSYNDVPDDDLADIFAYIRTISVDAPEIGDIDILNDIAQRKRDALEN